MEKDFDSCKILESLITEYHNRTIKVNRDDYKVGDLRLDPEECKIYVCYGKINSTYVWKPYGNSEDN